MALAKIAPYRYLELLGKLVIFIQLRESIFFLPFYQGNFKIILLSIILSNLHGYKYK